MPSFQDSLKLSGFAQYLAQIGLLTQHQSQAIVDRASQNNKSFITELVLSQLLSDEQIALKTADYFGLPFFDLSHYDCSACPTRLMRSSVVEQHQALPLFEFQHDLKIAVIDPTLPALNEITFLSGKKTHFLIVEAKKLSIAIKAVTHNDFNRVLKYIDTTEPESIDTQNIHEDPQENLHAPIVRFVNKILHDAIKQAASDIHFEPYEGKYRIRFRCDGLLTTVSEPPSKLASVITARLKIMSSLDISERRLPQDGRFSLKLRHRHSMEFRVNICPTLHGEKIVLRLLESNTALLNIESLGMTAPQSALYLNKLQHTQGMILVTGPTGSGKTITLYAGLNILNTLEKNICTVEDPVEIQLAGINQVHINVKTGLTFSIALRAFLRQDPDIIMVGEIRDLETAEIAVKASQTGHLVLSTLHTNSASETLVRLANMGIPAYNIASSIALIITQRLLRRLCPHCKKPCEIPKHTLLAEGFSQDILEHLTLYAPGDGNCQYCLNGYEGRLGIFEVMPISENMAQLIMEGGSAIKISAQAQREKILTLRQSGLEKVCTGLTSLAEINRIITV
jgi:type IV pilus assembly protein PilB